MTLLEIGRIGKSHGLRGEVSAALTSDRAERVATGAVWHLDDGAFTVEAARPHQQRWIVKLSGVDGREAAEADRQVADGEERHRARSDFRYIFCRRALAGR